MKDYFFIVRDGIGPYKGQQEVYYGDFKGVERLASVIPGAIPHARTREVELSPEEVIKRLEENGISHSTCEGMEDIDSSENCATTTEITTLTEKLL